MQPQVNTHLNTTSEVQPSASISDTKAQPFSIIFTCLTLIFIPFLFTQCALQGAPSGGPKDTLAPKLVKIIPENKSRDYKGKVVVFTFDEYIQVENLQQELIVTPNVGTEYEYKANKNGLILTFNKPFDKPNTTYTINLRNAIKDITEKNIAKDAKVVFSTGPGLDTLSIEGIIKDLETGQPVENAVVSLYRTDDTLDIVKDKPYYFTKTDKKGYYHLENIHEDNYKMYALNEKDNNQRYNQEKEKIGFLPKTLQIADSSKVNLDIKVSVVDENPPKISSKSTQSDLYRIEMNEGLINAEIRMDDSTKKLAYIIDPKVPKTIYLYNTIQSYDSLSIQVIAQDSAQNIAQIPVKIKFDQLDEKQLKRKTKFPFEVGTQPGNSEPVLKDFQYIVSFSKPVTRYDLSKIRLLADTLTPIPLDIPKDFQWNNSYTRLTLNKKVEVKTGVRFEAPKETFFSVENDTAKAIKTDHSIKDPERYGTMSGTVNTKEKYFIVQLVDNSGKVVAESRNQRNYMFRYLSAGDYNLRVVIDQNNNGKWDPASFKDRRIAEDIIFKPEKIKLKENWELTDQNISMP
ncbi:Ig-like domain-containing protein [Cytophagaceae bacterium YF14B1]|uniref:Ig-like domain-containing protein n=1 Tax=Xanthocytophaga flava TaxID=3048013 RepID=A0AAE3QNP6_9BACT|nr:Ig-like domain-containing protein [Xanthocytophaga flavus]MDJ1482430.1 Ig-like domain-containing protein [Xanthocytophaga flavus]